MPLKYHNVLHSDQRLVNPQPRTSRPAPLNPTPSDIPRIAIHPKQSHVESREVLKRASRHVQGTDIASGTSVGHLNNQRFPTPCTIHQPRSRTVRVGVRTGDFKVLAADWVLVRVETVPCWPIIEDLSRNGDDTDVVSFEVICMAEGRGGLTGH